MFIYTYDYVCVYIYIYIEREREIDRYIEREILLLSSLLLLAVALRRVVAEEVGVRVRAPPGQGHVPAAGLGFGAYVRNLLGWLETRLTQITSKYLKIAYVLLLLKVI